MKHEEYENLAALEAIGALSEDERRSLEEHLAGCPSCSAVHEELQQAAALLALSVQPVAPPPEIRQKLLERIGTDSVTPFVRPVRTEAVGKPASTAGPKWWMAAAAAGLFLVLWGSSEMRLRGERERMRASEERSRQLVASQQQLQNSNEKMRTQIASISAASTRTIGLVGKEIPSASARVFLDTKRRQAFVFFHDLPPNSGDKSYQLWIIPQGDKAAPLSVGVFDADEQGEASVVIENLPVGREIKGLAVTLEPRGGVPAPSGKMVMTGGNL